MKIAIVTFWYNEEDLAPFFLKHYSYVDDIYVYLDTATNDGTRSICEAYPNVTVRPAAFPKGYDSGTKISRINKIVRTLKHDWVYTVDADEFIQQPKQYGSAGEFLLKQQKRGYNLVIARMYQVFRHVTDKDLDITKPVLPQRSHGDPDLKTKFNRCYIKPIVAKPEAGIVWNVGSHSCRGARIKTAKEQFVGAHWKNADPAFAVKRRMNKKRRFSKQQIAKNRGWQDIHVTEKAILRALGKHRNDPDVLSSLLPR